MILDSITKIVTFPRRKHLKQNSAFERHLLFLFGCVFSHTGELLFRTQKVSESDKDLL